MLTITKTMSKVDQGLVGLSTGGASQFLLPPLFLLSQLRPTLATKYCTFRPTEYFVPTQSNAKNYAITMSSNTLFQSEDLGTSF